MIRPFTLITMVLAMLSGAYLFAVKHRAQVLDDQLSAVSDQTRLDEQRIRVLQAQWSLEIDPTRLSELAHQFTALQPMQPAQLTTMSQLASALPPPGSAPPAANPVAPVPEMPAVNSSAVASASSAPERPLPPEAASMRPPAALHLARAEMSSAAHPLRLAMRETRHPVSHSHIASDEFAENLAVPRPPRPLYPMGAQIMSVRATASPSDADNGSALAMGSDLAPPQPLEGANN